MVSDRAFMFHMCILCGKTFSSVPRSRSSVKVKYEGQHFSKMAVAWVFVFHKNIFLIEELRLKDVIDP